MARKFLTTGKWPGNLCVIFLHNDRLSRSQTTPEEKQAVPASEHLMLARY